MTWYFIKTPLIDTVSFYSELWFSSTGHELQDWEGFSVCLGFLGCFVLLFKYPFTQDCWIKTYKVEISKAKGCNFSTSSHSSRLEFTKLSLTDLLNGLVSWFEFWVLGFVCFFFTTRISPIWQFSLLLENRNRRKSVLHINQ